MDETKRSEAALQGRLRGMAEASLISAEEAERRGADMLRGLHQQLVEAGAYGPTPRLVVHQLAVAGASERRAYYWAPADVRPGDLLVIAREGRVFWHLATGNEPGSTVTVSVDADGAPLPPPGWAVAVHQPVLRWGILAGDEAHRTLGVVGEDGKLRAMGTGEVLEEDRFL